MFLLIMSQRHILTMSDQSDTDSSSASETSDTSDIDMGLDNKDPNLHNPIVRKCPHICGLYHYLHCKFLDTLSCKVENINQQAGISLKTTRLMIEQRFRRYFNATSLSYFEQFDITSLKFCFSGPSRLRRRQSNIFRKVNSSSFKFWCT